MPLSASPLENFDLFLRRGMSENLSAPSWPFRIRNYIPRISENFWKSPRSSENFWGCYPSVHSRPTSLQARAGKVQLPHSVSQMWFTKAGLLVSGKITDDRIHWISLRPDPRNCRTVQEAETETFFPPWPSNPCFFCFCHKRKPTKKQEFFLQSP